MKVFFHILIGLVLAALGAGLAWLGSEWIGQAWVLWVSAVLVFLGIVIGIRHPFFEGVVFAGVYVGAGYAILKIVPQILPVFCGATAGFSFFGIILGTLAWHEKAPQREAEERAQEHEIAREKEEIRKREAEWQEYERKVASLPVPTPKADIRECLEAFRTYLNRV